jgi:Phage integrase family
VFTPGDDHERKERILPLHSEASAALKDYIERWRRKLRPTCDYIFLNREGVQVSRRHLQREIKDFAARVGIDERTYPHLLRHSFATAMVRNGCPLPVVQKLLGHASISTTAIYTHVSPVHLRASYMAVSPSGPLHTRWHWRRSRHRRAVGARRRRYCVHVCPVLLPTAPRSAPVIALSGGSGAMRRAGVSSFGATGTTTRKRKSDRVRQRVR